MSRRTRRSISCLLLLIIWMSKSSSVFGQTQTTGAIRGVVFEQGTLAPISGAVVLLKNQENGLERSTVTNASGVYFIAMLPPGFYLVSGTAPGYINDPASMVNNFPIHLSKTNLVEPPPIVLRRVGSAPAPVAPPAALQPPTSQTLDSPNEQLVNTLNGARGGNFDRRQLTTLPLPGVRTFESLAFLLPGVAPPPRPIGGAVGPGIGAGIGTVGQFSVNGSRGRSNNFTVDGSDNNDEDIGVRRQGFVSLIPQNIESVQEFQISTHLWDAGNGRNTGSQVNAITQSGTNLIHGAVYGFFTDDALNARNFFDYSAKGSTGTPLEARTFSRITGTSDCQPGGVRTSDGCSYTAAMLDGVTGARTPILQPNPSEGENPFRRFQGGFTIGGPFSKKYFGPLGSAGESKTFFFTSFERQQIRARQETHFSVPTIAERGFLGSGASGFRIPGLSTLRVSTAVNMNPNGNCQGPNPSSPTGTCPTDALPIIRPTFTAGDSIFSLFPFPNNPIGPYGGNTLTQVLSANAEGSVFSFKFDHNFKLFGDRASVFTARYNFTNDRRQVPAVGDAIFASIEPRVGTQNLSLYLNTQFAVRTSNQIRGSFGRTKLEFDPRRDPSLLASQFAAADRQNSPFLINEQRLLNVSCFDLAGAPTNLPNLCAGISGVSGLSRNRFGSYSVGAPSQLDTVENNLGPIGQLIVTPYSPVGIDPFLFPQGRVNNTYQIADTLSLFRGNHIFTFGADIRRTQLNSFLDRNFRPQVIFGGSSDFSGDVPLSADARLPVEAQRLSRYGTTPGFFSGADLAAVGVPTGVFQSLSLGSPDTTIGLRLWQYNFFFQDSWRARRGLTLNFGLRYEYNTVPHDVNNRIERTFDLASILPPVDPAFDFNFGDASLRDTANSRNNQLYKAAIDATLGELNGFVAGREGIYDPDRNNFGPSIGFAWDPFAGGRWAGKTVIRGGAGIHYDVALGSVVSQSRNVFPTFVPFNVDVNTFNLAGPFIGSPRRNDSIANATTIRGRVGSSPSNTSAFVQSGCEFNAIEQQTGRVVYRCNLVQPGSLNVLGFPAGAQQLFLGRILNPTISRELTIGSGSGLAFTLPDRKLASPMVYHFNLQFERELFSNFLLNVAYVGSRGQSLTRFRTPNGGLNSPTTPLDPLLLSLAQGGERLRPAVARPPLSTAQNLTRPSAALGAYTIIDSSASSTYHAFQTSLSRRFTGGWQMTAAYTWSHAIDDVSDVFDLAGAFALPQNDRFLRAERGDANFDLRHSVTLSVLSNLPYTARFNDRAGLKGRLLGGWQWAGISTFQTGQPFTVNTSFDVNLDGNLTDRLNSLNGLSIVDDGLQKLALNGNALDLLAPLGTDGNVGRNLFRANGVANTDLALIKNFRAGEGQSITFRFEAFNVFNRTHFGTPVRILEAPSFGRSVNSSLGARQLQFALKYLF